MATTYLTDGNQATVAAAIAAASAGDTLVIPAGSWVWSAGVTINKSLILRGTSTLPPLSPGQGPGISSSVITRAAGLNGNTPLITIQPGSDVPVRVTGLRLDNGLGSTTPSSNNVSIQIVGSETTPIKQIRIDNCYFNTGSQVIWWIGGAYGVVDHCYFNNIWVCLIHNGGNLGDLAWSRGDYAAGSLNFPFCEDSIFRWALAGNPGSPWVSYHQYGARSVFRHNLVDGTNAPSAITGPLDAHGNTSYWTTPAGGNQNGRGTIRVEYYNNTLKLGANIFQIMDLRGGSHLVHDNTITTTDGSSPNIVDCRDEEDDPNNTGGIPVRSPVTWPCEDQVTATFVWNNTLNGVANNSVGIGKFGNNNATNGDPFYIKLNRDVWQQAPGPSTTAVYPAPAAPSNAAYPSPYAALQLTSYTPAVYPHPLAIPDPPPAGAGTPQGSGVNNPPFQPLSFPTSVPATKPGGNWSWQTGPWEDGVSAYSNAGPIKYSGQTQTKFTGAVVPPPIVPAKCVLPGAAIGMSALPVPPPYVPPPVLVNYSLFPATMVPTSNSSSANINVGIIFQVTKPGNVIAVRYYRAAASTQPTQIGALWLTSSKANMGQVNFTSAQSASGWQQQAFPSPIPIVAGTQYTISMFMPDGAFVYDSTNPPITTGVLQAPTGNGQFDTTVGHFAYPTNAQAGSNYYVDLVFQA